MTLSLVNRDLYDLLGPIGFVQGNDDVFRQWNSMGDICCAVAVKQFDSTRLVTVEIGFVSPRILHWSTIATTSPPMPNEGNGFGIFFRLDDFGIKEGFVFPPGGWSVSSAQEAAQFRLLLERHFLPKLTSLLQVEGLLTWSGWVRHFQEDVRKSPRGRGRAWALLGYSLLASPDRTATEIEAVIEEHARQDGSIKYGNRVDADIARQRELLLSRRKS